MARPGLSKHPKFRRLAVMLGSKNVARGALEHLWEVSYENGDAFIGDALDVELAAEWDGEAGKLATALVACRFLDVLDDGQFQVHDLWDHAPEYVRNRAKREDKRRAEGKTLSEIRSEAGKRGADARWQKANDGNRMATERQIATTPAPAPAPVADRTPSESCSEPAQAPPAEPPLLSFPCHKDGVEWHLTASKVAQYQETYPHLDVLAVLREARQWCIDNPAKRKTPGGMPSFCSRWLTKAQNSGHGKDGRRLPFNLSMHAGANPDPSEWRWGYSKMDHQLHRNEPLWQRYVDVHSVSCGWGGEIAPWPKFVDWLVTQ